MHFEPVGFCQKSQKYNWQNSNVMFDSNFKSVWNGWLNNIFIKYFRLSDTGSDLSCQKCLKFAIKIDYDTANNNYFYQTT